MRRLQIRRACRPIGQSEGHIRYSYLLLFCDGAYFFVGPHILASRRSKRSLKILETVRSVLGHHMRWQLLWRDFMGGQHAVPRIRLPEHPGQDIDNCAASRVCRRRASLARCILGFLCVTIALKLCPLIV